MDGKNASEKEQIIITKIKNIKNLSPFNRELSIKKRSSNELSNQNNNNFIKLSYSPFNHKEKQISTEKEIFHERLSDKNKEKEKNFLRKSPVNKTKNTFKKKSLKDNNVNNNYAVYESNKNMDESMEKKKKLYENQREKPFFQKYIKKIRETELAEEPVYSNITSGRPKNIINYSYREKNRNRDKIKDLIENINNKNIKSNRINKIDGKEDGRDKDGNHSYDDYNKKNKDKINKLEIQEQNKNNFIKKEIPNIDIENKISSDINNI